MNIYFLSLKRKKNYQLLCINKDLQKRINRNINFYKGVGLKILEIDKNGIGKIYDLYNRLEFEGEYSNKKKNGKGKEYFLGNLIFEGEFKNGKRNGNGKEYYPIFSRLVLSYEGEYKDGEGMEKAKNMIQIQI